MGECLVNTDNILIAESDLEKAQELCRNIDNVTIRNRAVANVLSANVASKMFDSAITVDIESGLHNIQAVLEDIDISDIYVNGSYVDVRFYFDDDGICVPKSHYDENILPVAYMFVKIDKNLSSTKLTGFILPKNIQAVSDTQGYFKVDESDLVSFYDIENYLGTAREEEISDEELYNYADGKVDNKGDFYNKLISSKDARCRLAKICSALQILNKISIDVSNIEAADSKGDFEDLIDSADEMYTNTDAGSIESEEESVYSTVTTPSLLEEESAIVDENNDENSEQLEVLFNNDEQIVEEADNTEKEVTGTPEEGTSTETTGEDYEDEVIMQVPKKKTSPLLFILLIAVIAAGGAYYGYNAYMQSSINGEIPDASTTEAPMQESARQNDSEPVQEAMPIETVENIDKNTNKNEAVSVEIPAIENNLDTSILVSNLKVDWEVPSGYASNTSARRYLVKLGKVIQLNLKTELLLLNRPPITNRIAVEIKYNNNSRKFETVGIVTSSGEKTIDDIIVQTVSKALKMNISVNTDSFDKLQGNPILIIKM